MKYVLSIALICIGSFFVACGQKGGDGGGPPPPSPATIPATNACACGVGNVFSSQYGACYMRGACQQQGYGFQPETQTCVPGTVVTAEMCAGTSGIGTRKRFGHAMQNINRAQFEKLLKYARVCDPYIIGWNFGNARCDHYSDEAFVIIETTGTNTATITIGAGASSPDNYNNVYGYMYGGNAYISLSLQTQIRLINNNLGTDFVGVDFGGGDMGFRATAENGTISGNTLPVQLKYQGVDIGFAPTQSY